MTLNADADVAAFFSSSNPFSYEYSALALIFEIAFFSFHVHSMTLDKQTRGRFTCPQHENTLKVTRGIEKEVSKNMFDV